MKILKKIPGIVVSIVLFLIVIVPSGYFMLRKDAEVSQANKAAWGQALHCRIAPESLGNPFGKPARREVNIICPQRTFERVLLSRAESTRETALVWQHSVTKQYFIANLMDDVSYDGAGPEPDYSSDWGGWFIGLMIAWAVAAGALGIAHHYKHNPPSEERHNYY